MIERKVDKPRCGSRPCYLYCSGDIPQKVKGKILLPGKRYCAGGKRIKPFRSSDPKVYSPSWCPLRKAPAELRIYCLKSSFTRMVAYMLRQNGVDISPSAADYAVRYEGTTDLTAKEFQQELHEASVDKLLGTAVHTGEIVEIDDGLTPYYFFFSEKRPMPYVIWFDGEIARKNQLEVSRKGDTDDTDADDGG